MFIDDTTTIAHNKGHPIGLEHSEKMDVIACLLDEGETTYVNEEQTAWFSDNRCDVGDMVTLSLKSTMEHTIVKKAKQNDLAFGYLLGKVQVKSSGYYLVTVAVLGDVFRLKLNKKYTQEISVNSRVYIDNEGKCNPIYGHNLKLISMATPTTDNNYLLVYKQLSEVEMHPESQNCLDLSNCTFEQDEITHSVNMIVPSESNIMAQANYVKDSDGVTYCELPDVAIVNDVRFVWEDNKLYMEWDGCDENESFYII